MKSKQKNRRYDAVIAGGGIAGLGAALALAKSGKKVLILSKEEKGPSTPAAAGILDPFLEMTLTHPLFAFSKEAFLRYPRFIKEVEKKSGKKAGYKKTGMIYLAMSPAEVREIRRRYAWQKKSGIPVRLCSSQSVLRAYAGVHANVKEGLYYPTIARVQPRKLTEALKAYIQKLGGRIEKVKKSPSLFLKKGRVCGVKTGKECIESPVVVNATGSWGLRRQGLGKSLPVLPARGQVLILKGNKKIPTILHSLDGGYIVPWGEQKPGRQYEYLAGSNVEFSGFKPVVTARGAAQIRSKNMRIFPALEKFKVVDRWAGLRPFSKKRRPLIGPSRVRGLWLAAGYYRSGILISAYAGELLAKSIAAGKPVKQLSAFDPRKFSL